ncbi:MAG: membrane-bound lytic murein transglycosylase MltF [Bdellovibrionaceae bacterium]|nr:membrane-bound lytic murein transglycosylase MltF [Pseudobdellovibrionaceae bacterium]
MSKINRLITASILGFATLAMNGCDAIYWDESASLATTKERTQDQQEIRVLTVKNPLTYSKDKTGKKFGIDHDLLENFGHHYNLKIHFIPVMDETEMKQALADGKGDIAAARMPAREDDHRFLVGPAYEDTFLGLFCQRKANVENGVDLNGKSVAILDKDNNFELYQRLIRKAPEVKLETVHSTTTRDLFRQMDNKEIDCVVAENLEGQYYARYYNTIEKVSALTSPYSLNWLVRSDLPELNHLLQAWFQRASREDEIMRVHDRYKLNLTELDQMDVIRFMKQTRRILPDLESDFRKAGREHALPWQLIAAVSYQESHWDNDAVSYTGVRGLMQLTQSTADHLGVEDRTDALQSIWGGSKYLRYLMNKTPQSLNDKDRMALTLAAYNIGFGHLRDAQKLAVSMGKNPNSWRHLRQILPLLEDQSYESKLEFGAARGKETVSFVERVAGFYNLMVAIQP